jgi:hypothetical protein
MKKKYCMGYRHVLSLVCAVLTAAGVSAQMAGVVQADSAVRQDAIAKPDGLDSIRSVFDAYRTRGVEEKLFVHADKPIYLAGEIIWFKLYCLDGSSHKPMHISKLAYVEVLDKDERFVLQGKIAMNNGEGNGSFYLPLSLGSGHYKLRAYTNWMKNFGPDYFYEQTVTIINTLKVLPDVAAGVGEVRVVAAGGGQAGDSLHSIAFFPEGGNLVRGIASRIAFRATGRQGKGEDCEGAVVDDHGDTITRFVSTKFGIGQFVFTPAAGDRRYRAVVRFGVAPGDKGSGVELVKELPEAGENGYVMRVDGGGGGESGEGSEGERQGGKMVVTVYAHNPFSPEVYLFGRTGQSHPFARKQVLSQDSASFAIDKDSLGEGITQWTVLDGNMRPVCERLSFRRPSQPLGIGVHADQQAYGKRKKVNVNISLGDGDGAGLSMAVYRTDSLQDEPVPDIYSWLWLGSDLKGRIDSAGYYLMAKGPQADQAIDNLMLTHGWRRFRWEAVCRVADKKMPFPNPPEYNGHIISGRLTDLRTGDPLVGQYCTLSVPGTNYKFQNGRTDGNGRVFFDIKDYYGSAGIVLHSGEHADSPAKVEIYSPFSEQYAGDRAEPFTLSKGLAGTLARRSLGMQVQNIYSGDSLQQFRSSFIDTLHFFGHPDRTYMLDDYTRFTTMEEVLREYVQFVNVNRFEGRLHLLMIDALRKEIFEGGNSLVLLDGVQVPDDKIFSYDPLKVRKLEVVGKRYFLGPNAYSGIVSFTTYKGNYDGFELDRHSILVDYEGMQWQREFYSPNYATTQESGGHLPDFRDLLFWSPDIHPDGKGNSQFSFYTSDLPGKYKIVVQGVGRDGRAGSVSSEFDVK